jgi:hypothetical protein
MYLGIAIVVIFCHFFFSLFLYLSTPFYLSLFLCFSFYPHHSIFFSCFSIYLHPSILRSSPIHYLSILFYFSFFSVSLSIYNFLCFFFLSPTFSSILLSHLTLAHLQLVCFESEINCKTFHRMS